ncbi:MAG: alanine racemase [Gammaproteobacteria bacterium]
MADFQSLPNPTRARVSLEAWRHNLARLKAAAPTSKMMAVIKANAYGHGAVRAARALDDADAFGVARLGEAIELRESGVAQPIVLMEGVFSGEELSLAMDHQLDLVVHAEYQVDLLEQYELLRLSKNIAPVPRVVWVKLDTGMSRLGLQLGQAAEATKRLRALSLVGELRLMTHFACADEPDSPMTREQVHRFESELRAVALQGFEPSATGLANSAGILSWPSTHREWVRAGIALYGGSPIAGCTAESLGLKPVMTLSTEVIALRSIESGVSVGYGATWRAGRASRIATLAVGYADGIPRHLPSGSPVLIAGRRVPIVGRVSMDMITVDVTDLPEVTIGSPAVMWGEGLPVDEIAAAAGTISYELLCGVTRRVAFDYV